MSKETEDFGREADRLIHELDRLLEIQGRAFQATHRAWQMGDIRLIEQADREAISAQLAVCGHGVALARVALRECKRLSERVAELEAAFDESEEEKEPS